MNKLFIRISILTCAVGFIVLGIARKEHIVVLKKAIKVCLECIGVG